MWVPPGTSIIGDFDGTLAGAAGSALLAGMGAGADTGSVVGAGAAADADEFCAGGIGPASCDQAGAANPRTRSASIARKIKKVRLFMKLPRNIFHQQMRSLRAEMLAG